MHLPTRAVLLLAAALVLTLSAAVPAAVQAQLEPLPWEALGPNGGAVTALAVHPRSPDTLYAGTRAGGIFVSLDGGRSWISRSFGLRDDHILSLALDPRDSETVYVGTSRDGLWRGTSWGQTWQGLHRGFSAPLRGVPAVAVDPRQPRRVYMSYGGELFRSNGGIEWVRAGTGLPPSVTALVIDPRQPRTLYAGTAGQGVFKSTDYGVTWTRVSRGLPAGDVATLVVDPASPRTLYTGLFLRTGPQVFKSTDGGATWRASSQGLPANVFPRALVVDPSSSWTVYVGTDLGVYKSVDGGRRWRPASQGLDRLGVAALAIHPSNPGFLWAGTGPDEGRSGGVYRSTNTAVSWRPARRGMTAAYVARVAAGTAAGPEAPSPLLAVTGLPGKVWASRSGGRQWGPASQGLQGDDIFDLAASPRGPGLVYAGTSRGVFRSTDGGATWVRKSRGIVPHDQFGSIGVTAVGFHAADPDVLYAAGLEWIFTSTDRGETWRRTGTALNTQLDSFATSPADPDVVYAGGRAIFGEDDTWTQLYRSDDAGESWEPLDFHAALLVAADPLDAETLLVSARGRGLFRSTDGGQTFDPVDLSFLTPRLDLLGVAFAPDSPGIAYAAGQDGGGLALVLRSQDSGVTWESLDLRALPHYVEILDLEVDAEGNLYLATRGNGIFRLDAGEL